MEFRAQGSLATINDIRQQDLSGEGMQSTIQDNESPSAIWFY